MITVIKDTDGPGLRTAIDLIEDTRRRGNHRGERPVETVADVIKLLETSLAEAKQRFRRTGEPADDATIATRAKYLIDLIDYDLNTKGSYEKVDITNYRHALDTLRAAVDGVFVPFRKQELETATTESHHKRDGVRTEERHESFGIIQATRCSGGGSMSLFASELSMHPHYIELRINRASQIHDGVQGRHTVWPYYGHGSETCPSVAVVRMSAAQFAELITTMNVGEGVPCTLAEVGGITMTPLPWTESAFNKAYKAALAHVTEAKDETKIQELLREGSEILGKKSAITAPDRARLKKIMSELGDGGASLAAWAGIQLQEARDKTVSVMKQELGGLASTLLTNLGMAALKDDPTKLLRLTGGPTKEDDK